MVEWNVSRVAHRMNKRGNLCSVLGALRLGRTNFLMDDNHRPEICRVKEWRVTLGITLVVSAVSSFVPV
jgi:hypothetical protein